MIYDQSFVHCCQYDNFGSQNKKGDYLVLDLWPLFHSLTLPVANTDAAFRNEARTKTFSSL